MRSRPSKIFKTETRPRALILGWRQDAHGDRKIQDQGQDIFRDLTYKHVFQGHNMLRQFTQLFF